MATTVTMPQLGESIVEGEIGEWMVKEGQRVERDQPLVTILTDKTDTEIPAPEGGVVVKVEAQTGDTVSVGDVLCQIDPGAEATAEAGGEAKAEAEAEPEPAPAERAEPPAASPSVRKLAREKDVDLAQLRGSGEGGRITRDDVLKAADGERAAPAPAPRPAEAPPAQPSAQPSAPRAPRAPAARAPEGGVSPMKFDSGAFRVPPYQERPGDEVVPFSRRRRIIADHMVYSKLTSPHVVTFAETDIHRTNQVRDRHKKALRAEGINLSHLAFVAAATCRALREYRAMNARVLDDAYVMLKDINLGIAVETEQGLVVPVIHHADELSVRGLARAIGELAIKARDGDLTPDDLSGKTFTISNPGRKGNLVGGAIISQPNVGILRMGEIKKRVVVVEQEGVDAMAIHPVMYMALSYDHRVVDGVEANGFLYRIHELLEEGDWEI
jgi:2-oxoglutarate dehydrogenase E2 component (dihydrolipoamide succinyltransferase)